MASSDELAARLRAAYSQGAVPPLRDGLDPLDEAGAYRIQRLNTQYWQGQGRRIVGWKIGLTAAAVQQQLGVSQPDFGALFADMQLAAGSELPANLVLQPKAEAEVALILGSDLDRPDATAQHVAAATERVCAAIEIVDSRIKDWRITYADTVADNGSAAFFVLAGESRPLKDLDLWSCGMVLQVNEAVVSMGTGAACLGHPLEAAAWLVRTLARNGQGLRAGDIVMTGALGPMVAIRPADTVKATIGGLGSCHFRYQTGA